MSDNKIKLESEGADGINKLISSLERLDQTLGKLATGNTALERMASQMTAMQAAMTTGFTELARLATDGVEKVRAAREKGADKLLQEQIKWEEKQHAQANKFHYKQIEAQDTALVRQRESYAKFWQGVLNEQLHAEKKQADAQQRRDLEMFNQATRANNEYTSWWDRALKERQAIQERRDMEMRAIRAREQADYVKWWEQQITTQEKAQARQLELARAQQVALHRLRASEEERARTLNTNFVTAPLSSQLATAEKARVYASMGGNAVEKYGSAAAGANIAALRRQLELVPGAAAGSSRALSNHNDIMREGHSLARGLAGSLGGLWLTYGSLVPLVAGAAIAGSLKNIVEVGKEVEHQLNFVYALSGTQVSLDKFLSISDTSLSSVSEAANAMRALAQNGLNASQSLQVLPSILQLATVGEMTVAQAALAATGAVAAFGLEFSEAGRVADIFAKTAANSNTSVLAITESMKQASTVASLFHVSIEETAAMLGLLAKINVTGGAAGTSFTNMLTGLYEPTEKGKRALKELGVETQTASGALKPYSQLLSELKTALSGFNDYARVDFLGDIFTVRGVKSAELALQNIDAFQDKVKEASTASGFMAQTIRILENDTEGAFKRLAVSVQSTFTRAFAEAAPYIQQIGLHLADAFKKDGDVQSGLTNLTVNIARMTGAAIDNAGAIALAIVGYKALGLLGPVTAAFKAAAAAQGALTVAQGAAAAASAAFNAAQAAGTATTAMYTAAIEAQTAATVAASAASRAWMATVLPALGALAVAVAAGAALWLLFRDNTNEADKANTKISNSLHVVQDQLDKEIARLEKVNSLWDERNMKYRSEGSVNPALLDAAQATFMGLQAKVMREGYDENGVRTKVTVGGSMIKEYHSLADELAEAKKNLDGLIKAHTDFSNKQAPGQIKEKVQNAQLGLKTDLENMIKEANARDSAGNFYIKDEKVRAVLLQAQSIKDRLMDPEQRMQGGHEIGRVETLRVDMKKVQDEASALRAGRAPKIDTRYENQEFQAALKRLDLERELARIRAQSGSEVDRARNARGELGDLALINNEIARKIAYEQEAIRVAKEQYDLAEAKDKPAKEQQYRNAQETGRARIDALQAEAIQKRLDLSARMVQEEKRYEAELAADKGDHLAAFTAQYQLQYGEAISKIKDDLKRAQEDLSNSENAEYAERLQQYLNFLARIKAAGEQDATFKTLQQQFDVLFASLDQKIQAVGRSPSEGSGIIALFDDAARLTKEYDAALPALIKKQQELAAAAEKGDPKQQKAALDDLKKLDQAAARMRNVWVDLGKVMTKSLTDAFGAGGEALGRMMEISLQFGARQQEIQNEYYRSKQTPEDERKAAMDTASAQINAYGQMTGAAAGFFDEQSKGYRTLMTMSKVFHAFELAQTMASLVPKAIAAILNQGGGDPYSAFARMAAMTALVAGLGVAVSGGSGSRSFRQDRLDKQGAGSVLGDSKAKSESLGRSLDLIEDHTYQNLQIGSGMLQALRSIESNISGFVSLFVRSTGLSGEVPNGGRLSGGILNSKTTSSLGTLGGAVTGGMFGMAAGGAMTMATTGAMSTTMMGALGGPIGLVVGALVGAVLGKALGKITSKIFGGEKFLEDTGLTIGSTSLASVAAGGLDAKQFNEIKTKGGWFSSDKFNTEYQSLGSEANRQFSQIVMSLADAVKQGALMLGVPADEFTQRMNSFVVAVGEISLKGKTGEEIQVELEAVFSKMGDDMARFGVAGLEPFQKVGEGYLETLTRVATGYQTVSTVMESLGMTFDAVGTGSIGARERLIELVGGLDNFTAASEKFLQDFFSEEERAESLRKRIQPTLDQFGLSTAGKDPMKVFRDFVVGLDTTEEAGAKAYATLIQIAPAFKTIVETGKDIVKTAKEIAEERKGLQDQLDDLVLSRIELLNKERGELDASNRDLFDQIQQAKAVAEARDRLLESYEAEASKLEATADRMKEFGRSLRDFRDGLKLGNLSPLTPGEKYVQARTQFDEILAKARAGDEDAQGKVQSAAQAFLEASRVFNASGESYTADYQRVINEMTSMSAWAFKQVDVARDSLTQLKLQVGALIDLKGTLEGGVLSIVTAINNLLIARDPNNDAVKIKAIEDAYKEFLGRPADAAGLKFWLDAMKNSGISIGGVVDAIKDSGEYKGGQSDGARAALEDAYKQYLGRPADQAGLSFWLQKLGEGVSMADVLAAIRGSAETSSSASSASTMSSRSAQIVSPYTVQVDNDETVAALGVLATKLDEVTTELQTLREEQAQQTGDQIEATMVAGQNSADQITDATTEALQRAKFDAQNQTELM